MSVLRISRPGQPTVLIDQGWATGRTTHSRTAIMGGPIVEPTAPKRQRARDYQAEHARRTKDRASRRDAA